MATNERKILTTLALDGEAEFKKSMDAAYNSMKVLGSEMKLNTAIFGDNASSMEGLTKKGEILAKEIAQQKEIVAALSKAVQDSAAAYGESDKKTDAYRIKLNNAQAALSSMEGNLKDNQSAIDDLGKKTQDADTKTTKWNEALKNVASTLGKGVAVAAKTAAVAVGTVAVAAGAAAIKLGQEVVKQFGELEQNLGGSEAVFGEYAKSIQKTGEDAYKNLGVSQSQYLATANKMGALFQGSGIAQQKSLELTEKAMQRAADMASVMGIETSVAMESIAGAAKGNFTMMDNLGVSMNATSIEAYALANGIKKSYNEMSNTEKTELAMQMFFEKTQQYAGNFAKESSQTISGSIGMMKAAVSSFVAGLGNADADMANLTQNMVTSLQTVVNNITPVLQNIVTALPAVVATIVDNIGGMLPIFIDTATGIFSQVLDTLVSLLPSLIPVATDAIMTITDALVANIPLILDAAMQLMTGLMNGIQAIMPSLIPVAMNAITMFANGLLQMFPQLILMGMDMVSSLVVGIIPMLPTLIPAAIEGVVTVVNGIIGALPQIIKAGIEMIVALVQGIINSIPKIIDAIPKIIESVVKTISTNILPIVSAGVQILLAIVSGIIKAIPQLIAALPQIILAIVSGLLSGLGEMGKVGLNLVQGIWEGIKNAGKWLYDKIAGWIDGVVGWIKDFLGIHSPSRKMRDLIGKPMVQGMAQGITKNGGLVDDAMASILPDTKSTALALDVTRRFNDVASDAMNITRTTRTKATAELSGDAMAMIEKAIERGLARQPAGNVLLDERSVGRYVRKVALA